MAKRIQRAAPVTAAASSQATGAAQAPARRRRRGRVPAQVVTDFTTQLAVLSEAGIPIVKALTILEGQTRPGPFKTVLQDLVEDVSAGTPLSESMGKHPNAFDRLYTSMVRAGESGGVLGRILTRLAAFREKAIAVKKKIQQALIYPLVVSSVALLVVSAMILIIIPKFEEIFRDLGGNLPASTQVLLDVSRFAARHWYVVVGAPIVLIVAHVLLMRRPGGYRTMVHRFFLRAPLVGDVVTRTQIANFSRTFGTLIEAGVPHLDALGIVRDATANDVVATGVEAIRVTVREGEGIARPMGETGVFDDLVVNMVDVGEATGELDRMLLKVADAYEVSADRKTQALLTLLEPALIIALAGIVGFIVVALFMPLLEIMGQLGEA